MDNTGGHNGLRHFRDNIAALQTIGPRIAPPNRLSVLYSSTEAFNALGLDRSMPPLNKPPFGCAI